jgi:putative addiction module killer protein
MLIAFAPVESPRNIPGTVGSGSGRFEPSPIGIVRVTIIIVEIREYLDATGRSPYAAWFDRLDKEVAARVVVALTPIRQGNLSNIKGVGSGIYEYRIDFGPGYRIYLGKDGERLLILVGGGTKKRQANDINLALARWQDYKRRKRNAR